MEIIFAGLSAGIASTLVGFPLDSLKVLKQGTQYQRVCHGKIHMFDFYRGIRFPLMQNIILSSVVTWNYKKYEKKMDNKLLASFYLSLIETFLVCPIDKFKIMSQQHVPISFTLRNIQKSFKDLPIVALRKIPGTTIYFFTYQSLTAQFEHKTNTTTFISGSIAGLFSWIFTYPIDTIKTRIQGETSPTISHAIKRGMLWKGISFCLFRACIVNGVYFSVFEGILKHFQST